MYPEAQFLVVVVVVVVVVDGARVGRLYLDRIDNELRVIDIALLPERRGRGIGSALMASITEIADRQGQAVTLHVEPWNRAKRLYERLGFVSEGLSGIYELMRRPARLELS